MSTPNEIEKNASTDSSVKFFRTRNDIPFICRPLLEGDSFGLDFALIHKGEPIVEYYDARFPHTQYGQFVSRYHLSTLIEGLGEPHDLSLHGNVENWVLDWTNLAETVRWAKAYISSKQAK